MKLFQTKINRSVEYYNGYNRGNFVEAVFDLDKINTIHLDPLDNMYVVTLSGPDYFKITKEDFERIKQILSE